MILITKKSSLAFVKREFGGKGLNLFLMSKENLPVPEWVGISAGAFEQFKKETGIESQNSEILNDAIQTENFSFASEKIGEIILSMSFPSKLLEQI